MNYTDYLKKLYRPPLIKSNRGKYVCLDKNEPPFSAFEVVDGLFKDHDVKMLREYPDLYELYVKLSVFVGVDIENLIITQGSEQALKYVFEVFVQEGDEVVYFNPSFSMYDVFSYIKKARVKYIDFDLKGSTCVEVILKNISKKTKLFSLINPHNFTGTMLPLEDIKIIAQFTSENNTIFLLDEAYFHYVELETACLINQYENLIITRTFSKALGIPAARVGYAISTKENIELLRKFKPIDEIDYFAGLIAVRVLDNANSILLKNINQVRKWQRKFEETQFDDIKYIHTFANFILIKSLKYEYHKKLLFENNFLVKSEFAQECLKNCIRFSIIDDNHMEKLFNLLKY